MSSLVSARERAKNTPRSKNVPWFQSNIGSSLSPAGRQLLEEYSGVASADVEANIHRIRDIAWEIFPWPCVGQFWFVTLGLARHPYYAMLLARLCTPSSKLKLLDVGTCLRQDLRKLVADGVPVDRVFGADLFEEYEAIGHQLFRDEARFANRYIVADLFDDSVDGLLVKSKGTWDIVNIIMFLHIWDLDMQTAACKRIVKLLRPVPGSMIIGAQTGCTQPGELHLKPPHVAEGQERSIYRHNLETFKDMWKEVGKDEGVRLDVKVEYDDQESRDQLAREEQSGEKNFFFQQSPDQVKLFFTVELV